MTILKLQHDILRSIYQLGYRPIMKVQKPNLRICSPLSPCLSSPLRLSLSSLYEKKLLNDCSVYTEKSFAQICNRSVDIANLK